VGPNIGLNGYGKYLPTGHRSPDRPAHSAIAIPIALSWFTPFMVIKQTLYYYFVGDLFGSEVDAEGRCVNSYHANTCIRAYEFSLHMNTLVTCSVQCEKLYEFWHTFADERL